MDYSVRIRGREEKAMFDLRALYEKYGYSQYRVSRFEEYDLYAQNRSFLIGTDILTFTDTNGRLMALKPDITMSIIKSTKKAEPSLVKAYYNENVYRAGSGTSGFREIPQTGLECIGELDLYSVCEVLLLAAESLDAISPDYIMDISHVGLVSGFLEDAGAPASCIGELLQLVGNKNAHDAALVCRNAGMSDSAICTLETLIHLRGPLESALDELKSIELGEKAACTVKELSDISSVLGKCCLNGHLFLDLSLQCDPGYYNGVVFRGFVGGIPTGILSGGRYDGLMRKMGKASGAIGFAVYLDLLQRWGVEESEYDSDVLLLLGEGAEAADVMGYVSRLLSRGETVRVDRRVPDGMKFRRLMRAGAGGLTEIEASY